MKFLQNDEGMKLAYDAAHGKPVPNTTFLNAILIDPSNVDEYLEK